MNLNKKLKVIELQEKNGGGGSGRYQC